MKNTSKKEAFTLIELVLGIGLSIIIVSLLTGILKTSSINLSILKSQNKVLKDSHFLLNYLEDEIKNANYIIDSKNQCGFVLVFKDDNKYRYVYYSFNHGEKGIYRHSLNSKVKLKKDSRIEASKNLLASNISKCKFDFDGEKVIVKFNFKDEKVSNEFEMVVSNRSFGEY